MRYLILAIALFNIAATGTIARDYTDYCADANCMGCWRFEEDLQDKAFDSSGEGGMLVETSGTIPIVTSDDGLGNARDFELGDTEEFVQSDGLSTDISGANQAISICAWINSEETAAGNYYFVSKYDTGANQRQYGLQRYNDGVGGDVAVFLLSEDSGSGSGYDSVSGTTNITEGVWYHVCGVYDDIDMKIYLNGESDASPVAKTDGIYDGSAQFYIGARLNSGTHTAHYDGKIDEVIILDRALSATEVKDIYENGLK